MALPYVFITTCTAPDREFKTVLELAAFIHAQRQAAGGHALKLINSVVAREAIPDGQAIAVRLRDGKEGVHGSLLGFAFMRWSDKAFASPGRALLAAIEDVASNDERRAA